MTSGSLRVGFAGTPAFAARGARAPSSAAGFAVPRRPDPARPPAGPRPARRALPRQGARGRRTALPVLAAGDAAQTPEGRADRARQSASTCWSWPPMGSSCRRRSWRGRGTAASTSTRRSCRAGAAPRRSSARSMAGDAGTGVTIMQMDEGLDTGPMIERRRRADRAARDRGHADGEARRRRRARRSCAVARRGSPATARSVQRRSPATASPMPRRSAATMRALDWRRRRSRSTARCARSTRCPARSRRGSGQPRQGLGGRAAADGRRPGRRSLAGDDRRGRRGGVDVACGDGVLRLQSPSSPLAASGWPRRRSPRAGRSRPARASARTRSDARHRHAAGCERRMQHEQRSPRSR